VVYVLAWAFAAISATPAWADGDPANGAKIFQQCAACHSPEKGVNLFGPSLHCVVGRPAGSIPGYDYSPAMQEAAKRSLTWTAENIVAYLENPHKYLENFDQDPGVRNKMPFMLPDMQQRQDVIAYLKSLSAGQCNGGP
jgi:cytochrome c